MSKGRGIQMYFDSKKFLEAMRRSVEILKGLPSDMLFSPFHIVVHPPDTHFPEAVVYFQFNDGTEILADLTTPIHKGVYEDMQAAQWLTNNPDIFKKEQT